jgi:tetratricopeptide (TPR) repeat protein
MRRLADLYAHCDEFIWQPDDHVLLVSGVDGDIPYVLKVLEQVEGNDEASLYMMIGDPYLDPDTYARTVAGRCVEYYAMADAERQERGEPPLEPFPEALTQAPMSPRDRIVMAIEHLGVRLPDAVDYRVVFALLPMQVHDWGSYAKFVAEFTRLPPPAPQRDEDWPVYARMLFRDTRDHELGAALGRRQAEGMLATDVDMSTDAMAADMAEDAVDPSLAVAQRMQATLQLAQIDFSYKRYEEAAKKFGLLYGYYEKADAPLMQAMCLQGAGDCLRAVQRPPQALERYQQGLAIALAAKPSMPIEAPATDATGETKGEPLHPNAPPIMLNLLLAAAPTCMDLRKYEDAQSYYESASKLAAKCMNPFAACDALQGEGDAWRALDKPADALAKWRDCETISEKYEYFDRLVSVLERIHRLYDEGHMRKEADEAFHKLQGAKHLQKHGKVA